MPARLHWSVPDPVPVDTAAAFEPAYEEIEQRVDRLCPSFARSKSNIREVEHDRDSPGVPDTRACP